MSSLTTQITNSLSLCPQSPNSKLSTEYNLLKTRCRYQGIKEVIMFSILSIPQYVLLNDMLLMFNILKNFDYMHNNYTKGVSYFCYKNNLKKFIAYTYDILLNDKYIFCNSSTSPIIQWLYAV